MTTSNATLRPMRVLASCVIAVAIVVMAACESSSTEPTGPRGEARVFLDSTLRLMQENSVKKDSIDWPALRAQVLDSAGDASTTAAALPSIAYALALIGDNHSWLRRPDGTFLSYPRTVFCTPAGSVSRHGLPSDIGYVRVPSYGGTSAQSAAYTTAIQDALRLADADTLAGWVVDLRGNSGGNMWPMIAALWPFLQDVVGHFRNSTGFWSEWSVIGLSSFDGPFLAATTAAPHYLQSTSTRVAVWANGSVASSGEAVVVAFKGRPDTRSFGAPTCGLSTGVRAYSLPGGFTLGLARSVMADRDSTLYGGQVVPDETIADTLTLMTRTVEWLRTGM